MGRSVVQNRVLRQVETVAATGSMPFLFVETGARKEAYARECP
jgi:transcriptional regulator with GAF, ATPase, and Fis domain